MLHRVIIDFINQVYITVIRFFNPVGDQQECVPHISQYIFRDVLSRIQFYHREIMNSRLVSFFFESPFCQMDDITLKTMIRSNPGLMLIKNGTILNKWSDEDIPDEYVLTDKLENLPLGQQKVGNDVHTVGCSSGEEVRQ